MCHLQNRGSRQNPPPLKKHSRSGAHLLGTKESHAESQSRRKPSQFIRIRAPTAIQQILKWLAPRTRTSKKSQTLFQSGSSVFSLPSIYATAAEWNPSQSTKPALKKGGLA